MPLQVHHRHIVARVGEKDMQQVLRPQAEAGVVLAGEIFINCSRYELGFWEMAWTLER